MTDVRYHVVTSDLSAVACIRAKVFGFEMSVEVCLVSYVWMTFQWVNIPIQ